MNSAVLADFIEVKELKNGDVPDALRLGLGLRVAQRADVAEQKSPASVGSKSLGRLKGSVGAAPLAAHPCGLICGYIPYKPSGKDWLCLSHIFGRLP